MKLCFVRHGETDWNVDKKIQGQQDISLNGIGRKQAHELGVKIQQAGFHFAGIYTSPQLRAKETADILSELLEIPATVMDGLKELSLGSWEGMSWSQVKEQKQDEFSQWDHNRRYAKIPGGESYQLVLERTLHAIRQIMEQENEDVLIVSHSGVIMTLLSYVYQTDFRDMKRNYGIKNADWVILDSNEIDFIQNR
ncbi:MAG: histidine phosphatase family protein [Clostridia bacterium]|nr:histidine phosphatase family protein [Clostridia bacterium]